MSIGEKVLATHLESQLKEYTNKYKIEREKADKRYNYLATIAEKICSSVYGEKQLGGKNKVLSMSDMEIRDFIIRDHIEQRSKYIESINQLQKLYIDAQKNVQDLSDKVLEQRAIINEKEKEIFNLRSGNGVSLNEQIETSYDPETGEIIETPVSQQELELREAKKDKDKLIMGGEVYDLKEIAGLLTEKEKVLLTAVGIHGYSETSSILQFITEELNIKQTAGRSVLTSLEDKRIIRSYSAATALNPRRNMYSLTKLGRKVFEKAFEKIPVVSEKERLEQMHASLRHGVCIKDTATILENLGYTNVSYDEKANTISVSGGQRYVPDVIAETDKGIKTFWEVELGHHHDADFFDKLDKAARVSNEVFIISSTEGEWKNLKRQVSAYQGKKMIEKVKNTSVENAGTKLTIYLGTMKELMNRNIFTSNRCRFEVR